jgi:ubiquinone/menaquinone biosynthesis C-methylase UbiE
MVLAKAIMTCYGFNGLLKEFVNKREAKKLKILEINPAGHLTQYLQKLPGHTLKMYPEIDMMNLPFGNDSFDLVIHSDTLEHIIDPVKGLSECNRVLDIGGYCIFTIPMIVDRLSVTREDAAPSYHGAKDQHSLDMIVYTEYGADAWKQVVNAGFSECRIYSLEYPSAHAFIGLKSKN